MTKNFLFIFGIGSSIIGIAHSLYCYNCAASTGNASCIVDTSGLVGTRLEFSGPYSKDCDLEINQTMCVIETTQNEGALKTMIRGCSDGFTFSYPDIKLFRHLRPTNQTQCGVFTGSIVCVTLCRQDYCNGPQDISPDTTSIAASLSLPIIVCALSTTMYGLCG